MLKKRGSRTLGTRESISTGSTYVPRSPFTNAWHATAPEGRGAAFPAPSQGLLSCRVRYKTSPVTSVTVYWLNGGGPFTTVTSGSAPVNGAAEAGTGTARAPAGTNTVTTNTATIKSA